MFAPCVTHPSYVIAYSSPLICPVQSMTAESLSLGSLIARNLIVTNLHFVLGQTLTHILWRSHAIFYTYA